MSLPHVLLGMLAEPASGYELKQQFEQSVRHFWYAELSQIYPALARLEKEGMLVSEMVTSSKGPSKKIYSRTTDGKKALKSWIAEGPVCRTERLAYLTQLFFLDEVSADKRVAFFEELRDDFKTRLKELQTIEKHWSENDSRYPDDLPDEAFYKQMTLRSGLLKYQVMIDWCTECLNRMNSRI